MWFRRLKMILILASHALCFSSCLKVLNNGCDKRTPETITDPASFVTPHGAILNGRVSAKGQNTVVAFEFGINELYGNVYDLSLSSSDNSIRQVSIEIAELNSGTTYHYRTRVIGECETVFGEDRVFTTLGEGETGLLFNSSVPYGTLQDIDGNTYKTVKIGAQTWMAENLRTSRLTDGSPVSYESIDGFWLGDNNPAYCWYRNSALLRPSTGNYYNWYSVNTSKLCPDGWHVSSDSDWNALVSFLGGEVGVAGKLKQNEGSLWLSPNTGATNSSGFTAVPAGYRDGTLGLNGGNFAKLGERAYFWTSTSASTTSAKYRTIDWAGNLCGTNSCPGPFALNNKSFGFSVRCVKD